MDLISSTGKSANNAQSLFDGNIDTDMDIDSARFPDFPITQGIIS